MVNLEQTSKIREQVALRHKRNVMLAVGTPAAALGLVGIVSSGENLTSSLGKGSAGVFLAGLIGLGIAGKNHLKRQRLRNSI